MRGQLIENYNIAAAQAGVPSVSALHVLAAVATMPEGVPFDSSRLAVTTDYHKASTGTALRWMVEKGYARKRPERGRNGVLRYELTEDGGALIELLKLRPEPAPPEPEPARIAYPDPDPDPALESAVDQALAAIVPIDPPDTDALAASIATLVATVKALERSVATRSGIVLTLELPRVVYVAVAGGPDRISSASEVSSEHIRALNCLVGAVKGAE